MERIVIGNVISFVGAVFLAVSCCVNTRKKGVFFSADGERNSFHLLILFRGMGGSVHFVSFHYKKYLGNKGQI